LTGVFRGISLTLDIVDCWDRLENEPANIEFVIGDLRRRTCLTDSTYDVVHIRHMRAVCFERRLLAVVTR
jgi:hypothetical protein